VEALSEFAAAVTSTHPVAHAERIFRELLGDPIPSHHDFLEAVRRFHAIDFNSSGAPDSDGFLFQYGAFRSHPEPGFHVSIVRQFEIATESGDHDYYVQTRGDYRYAIEPDLEALKVHVSWWFTNDDAPFDDWFARVVNDPVWTLIGDRPPLSFAVDQDDAC
jgi:hypothetical protein